MALILPKLKYSVIQAVYSGDCATNFLQSVNSVIGQTIKPHQYIIVCDGELNADLENVCNQIRHEHHGMMHFASLDKKSGLGACLNVALQINECEFVGRMDSDDICEPHRFEILLKEMQKHTEVDVIGSFVQEIET